MSEEKQTCIICGETKPISEYYVWSSNGKHMKRCRDCHAKRQKVYNKRFYEVDRHVTLRKHEQITIEHIRKQGIFCLPGRVTGFSYTDAVAWGCVRVEIKLGEMMNAQARKYGYYTFRFTKRQRTEGLLADIVVLYVPVGEGEFYVLPADHPVFYDGDKLRGSVTYNPNSNGAALTHDIMDIARDNWQIIEDQRELIIQSLIDGSDTIVMPHRLMH